MKQLCPEELNKLRKRRLRKKLRLSEFQEFGFEIEIHLNHDSEITFDDVLEAWIAFVESRNWAFGGGGDLNEKIISGFVAKDSRGTLMEEDRLSVEKWLNERDWVTGFQIGQLKDAWHGW